MSSQTDQLLRTQFSSIVQQSKQMARLAEQEDWKKYHLCAQRRHAEVVAFFETHQLSTSAWLGEAIEEIKRYDAVGELKLRAQQKEIQHQLLDVKKAVRAVNAYNKTPP